MQVSRIPYPGNGAPVGAAGTVDVTAQGTLSISFADEIDEQLALLQGEPGWTLEALAVWHDRHISHPDLTQRDVASFILHALSRLIDSGVTLDRLARDKYRIRKLLEARIDEQRREQRKRAFQAELFGGTAGRIEVVPEVALVLDDENRYAPNWIYEGAYRFRHHLFAKVGELAPDGAEFECAAFLDEHAAVECWVRNLAGRQRDSFWLQTSSDRYYPDFVGRLRDGRVFAVEFKGDHLWSADDATEKRRIGALWQELSGGHCIHVMPRDRDWSAINAAFA